MLRMTSGTDGEASLLAGGRLGVAKRMATRGEKGARLRRRALQKMHKLTPACGRQAYANGRVGERGAYRLIPVANRGNFREDAVDR
jgi:hypothetical protein